ncbi:hypothetical protein [Nostoc sp.]
MPYKLGRQDAHPTIGTNFGTRSTKDETDAKQERLSNADIEMQTLKL